MTTPTAEEYRIIGLDAQQLKSNKAFRMVLDQAKEYITSKELNCDLDDSSKAARLILMRQTIALIERQLESIINNGIISQNYLDSVAEKKNVY